MISRPITYRGKKYKTLKALYQDAPDRCGKNGIKVSYSLFARRLNRGWLIKGCLYKHDVNGIKISVEYNGKVYSSVRELHNYLSRYKHDLIGYPTFLRVLKKHGVEHALKRKRRSDLKLAGKSRDLGGKDNLLWQRVHTLGWSMERALNTPIDNVHRAKKVRYHGVVYPSMTKCYKAVKPRMNYAKFVETLRTTGCVID